MISKLDPSTHGLVNAAKPELEKVVWELLGGSKGKWLGMGAGGRAGTEGRWSGSGGGDEPA